MRARSVVRAGTVSCLLLAACDTPGIRLIDPEVHIDPASRIMFSVNLEESTLAASLGWTNGVPEATVIVQRVAEPFAPESLTTDSVGQVSIPEIFPGQARETVARRLLRRHARHAETDPQVRRQWLSGAP